MEEVKDAGSGTVETPEVVKPDDNQPKETDYKAQFEAAMSENARLFEEKENYRRGMLKAKGKMPEENDDIDSLVEEKVKKVLDERTFDEKIKASQETQKAILDKLALENSELKNALKNGGLSIPVSAGSNLDRPEPAKKEFFSQEQLADMKKRGLDPEKVKANMLGYHSNPDK